MKAALALGRRLLAGWVEIAARFGEVQTLLLLSLFYAVLIGPVAVVAAIGRSDFLDRRGRPGEGSAWREADTAAADLERAKRQF